MTAITFPTAATIIGEVESVMGEVAGPAVQSFDEDQLLITLRQVFNMVFIKRPWEHYLRWDTITLDETTGKCSEATPYEDVVGSIENFIGVYVHGQFKPLPILNNRINPNVYTGTRVHAWSSLPVSDVDFIPRRLQFWPKTATGTYDTLLRLHPGEFIPYDTIYLDKDMLVYATAWMRLEDDGTNPTAANRMQNSFDNRFQDIVAAIGDHPISLGLPRSQVPDQWFVAP